MSNKYKHGDKVPDEVLYERMNQLIRSITTREDFPSDFYMRIPAELDRDADLVMSQMVTNSREKDTRIKELEEELALQESHYDCEVAKNKELEKNLRRLVEISESFQELMYMDDMVKYEEEIEEIKHIRRCVLGDES